MYYIGRCFETGLQGPVDYQLAQQYYQMAAERGCDAAKIRLGCLFEHGLGVYRNLEKAFACYQQADGTVARFHQGRCYRQGIGCSPNLAEAEYPLFRAFGMISGLRFMNMWRWQNQGSRPPNLIWVTAIHSALMSRLSNKTIRKACTGCN
ncbi:MAG: hypothetical protein AAHH96_02810 [Candidatus Symbiodolus clandestinus]